MDRDESRRQIAQAEQALARRDVAAAIPLLETAWKHDPLNDELPLMVATLYLQEGDAIRAAHRVVESLVVRPFNPSALDALAVACSEALQPELAQRILRRAIRMAPGVANAKRNLEDAKQRAKEMRQAAVDRQEILRAAHFLPQKAIARLLDDREPELTACIVAREGGNDRLQATLESARTVTSSIVVVDAREDEHDPRGFAADGTTIRVLRGAAPGGEPFDEALRHATSDWCWFWSPASDWSAKLARRYTRRCAGARIWPIRSRSAERVVDLGARYG